MDKSEKFDCFDLPLIEYYSLVKVICQNWREELSNSIDKILPFSLNNDVAIVVVGSDGKEERHPQSKTELVILYNSDLSIIPHCLSTYCELGTLPVLCCEIKAVGDTAEVLSFYRNSSSNIFPDRVLNSIVIWGNQNLHLKARRQVITEMVSDDQIGKKIREEMRNQLSNYKQALLKGRYRGLPIFDSGKQYYFESEDPKKLQLGFKMGPLRCVQRRLDLLTIEAWKKGMIKENDLSNLPTNTYDKIDYFSSLQVIDVPFALQLKNAYLWFLREYHRAQEIFKNSDRISVINSPYNQEVFEQYKDIIYRFSLLGQR